MKQSNSKWTILPILFGFFVMGFVDVVGISTNYVKQDFGLSDTLANLIPMMVFLWFAIFSIPPGMLMGRIGRRNTVAVSLGITIVAMLLPLFLYDFAGVLLAFALLGIGNTILQVSLNPMVASVVVPGKVTSVLTLGQFLKAVSSFLGPLIAGAAASFWGNWKWIFAVYAVTTLLSLAWLLTGVHEEKKKSAQASTFATVCSLFKDRYIVMLFIGILLIVGIDVGLNTTIPKLLMEKTGMSVSEAGLGSSLYFSARTIGSFVGAFLLAKIASDRFMQYSMMLALVGFILLLLVNSLLWISVLVVIVGLACSNVFSIIFSYALQHLPERDNEISALMIMGVSGGALVTPLMGILSDAFGQVAGLSLLLFCLLYLGWISFRLQKRE